jgi:hypothetical protein
VVAASGSRIAVYGTTSAAVGETAYRHGILLHQLADSPEQRPASGGTGDGSGRAPGDAGTEGEGGERPRLRRTVVRTPRRIGHRPGPVRPVGYEMRRAYGVRTPWPTVAAALLCSLLATALLVRTGTAGTSPLRLLSGWAPELPLPAAAVGAGLLGALSYGQEFRYPALAPGYGPEPRSLRLLAAKLAVGALTAALLAAAATAADLAALHLLAGHGRAPDPAAHPAALAVWTGLAVACSWAGVLAAALFRTTALGFCAVLAVPLLVVPGVRALLGGQEATELADAGDALWSVLSGASQDGGGRVSAVLRFAGQPLVLGLALVLLALAGAYAASTLRGRRQERRSTALQTGQTAPLTSKKG